MKNMYMWMYENWCRWNRIAADIRKMALSEQKKFENKWLRRVFLYYTLKKMAANILVFLLGYLDSQQLYFKHSSWQQRVIYFLIMFNLLH